jgi:hypothetical protein
VGGEAKPENNGQLTFCFRRFARFWFNVKDVRRVAHFRFGRTLTTARDRLIPNLHLLRPRGRNQELQLMKKQKSESLVAYKKADTERQTVPLDRNEKNKTSCQQELMGDSVKRVRPGIVNVNQTTKRGTRYVEAQNIQIVMRSSTGAVSDDERRPRDGAITG